MADVILKGEWLRCGRGHGVGRALDDVVVLGPFPASLFSEWMMAPPDRDCPECACGARIWPDIPKPTTPQPPEWKVNCAKCLCGAGIHVRGCPKREPEMSPLDRALSDFTARRKAKRAAGWTDGDGHIWEDGKFDDAEFCELCGCKRGSYEGGKPCPNVDWLTFAQPLSRAMSTPLPHDPPMSARLMPWRGKE